MIKIERNLTPSPSFITTNNTTSSTAATSTTNNCHDQFNYNLKISNPISWALNPKSEFFQLDKTNKKKSASTVVTSKTATTSTLTTFGSNANNNACASTTKLLPTNSTNNTSTTTRIVKHGTPTTTARFRIAPNLTQIKLVKCKKEINNKYMNEDNMIYSPTVDKPWICKNCNRNYKWKNSLKCHLKNECGLPPKYFCLRNCGYKTNIHSNLKRHLNSKFCKPHFYKSLGTDDDQ